MSEDRHLADLFAFLDVATSPRQAVDEAARRLTESGFEEMDEAGAWEDTSGRRLIRRGGTLVAWAASGSSRPEPHSAFRLVGAHTDSPGLRIRPIPDTGSAGYRQIAVEVYGGTLRNSWLDRDLGISGSVVIGRGSERRSVPLRIDRPLMRVPQLAIHLDREVNKGLTLDPQRHLTPVWALGDVDEGALAEFLASELGVPRADVRAWNLVAHDVAPAARLGRDREFYASGRIDNLVSCHAALTALTAPPVPTGASTPARSDDTTAVVVLFDHEEIGSTSYSGAAGALLPSVLQRLVASRGGSSADLHRAVAASWCLSVDGAHATHPNYVDRHEPGHHISLNGGPVVKINANQRYATDAVGQALFADVCEQAGVPLQIYSHRNDIPCGSTIGPLTAANLGMATIDVGAPQLSMHSAREMGGAADPAMLTAAIGAFLNHEG